jgi:CheY-like chemotaxis protein
MTAPADAPWLVAFMDDLMFLCRIKDAARSAGLQVQSVREPAALVEACRVSRPAVIFVDLDSGRLPALDAVAAVRSHADLQTIPVVGFLGHTRTDLARAAENAGCTRVLTRGAFVNELRSLILSPPSRVVRSNS